MDPIAARTAGLRAVAMAKSAPASTAAWATSPENSPESARSRARPTPSGSAAIASAISAGACGRTSWSPASSVPVSTSPASAQTSGTGRPARTPA
ncbi:MAG TPA: hypothetical protein VKP11_00010 [Frankiaceae bacterium]|nr:hypothetical protein [Frankiaceae bacterium]